ncbi:MAG: preprotein translocase subunit SecY [Candidatus Limnocylindrales bacterium]
MRPSPRAPAKTPDVFESLLNAFRAPDIRRRLLYVAGILIIFRFLAHVPVPGVDRTALASFFNGSPLFGLLDLFSGGGLSTFSIVGLGLNPYINASIIMQLMTGVIPSLQALSREGEYGRNKINQYTRYLGLPMAMLQAYGFLALLNAQGTVLTTPLSLSSWQTITQIVSLTAGSIMLMFLGELITEKGIGNGISFIIFAGIVGRVPGAIQTFIESPDLAAITVFIIIGIAAVFAIIYIQEGQRRIPIQYASRVRGRRMYQGGSTFLPLRVNQAGVIPIIFAISILLFPQQLASYFSTSTVPIVADISLAIVSFLNTHSAPYLILYFVLTVGFTYFYTAFTFKPDETAEQLRKNGGFIPGIRPGRPTQDYLAKVVFRITIAGALFLGLVAVAPQVVAAIVPSLGGIGLGGTGLLIVVSVVVETMKQIEAQLMMRNYEGFIR